MCFMIELACFPNPTQYTADNGGGDETIPFAAQSCASTGSARPRSAPADCAAAAAGSAFTGFSEERLIAAFFGAVDNEEIRISE
jgi:hypothetical protein